MFILDYVGCGGGVIEKMNAFIPELTHMIVLLIKIGVPVLLVILGMIDLLKATIAQKEDEIKKAQGLFLKRLLAGVLVYFVFLIVQVIFSVLGDSVGDKENIWDCVNCFIDGPDYCNSVSP